MLITIPLASRAASAIRFGLLERMEYCSEMIRDVTNAPYVKKEVAESLRQQYAQEYLELDEVLRLVRL